jgi:hypothetical protein
MRRMFLQFSYVRDLDVNRYSVTTVIFSQDRAPDPSAFLGGQDCEEEATGVAEQQQSSGPPVLSSALLRHHAGFAGARVKEARC